MNPDVRPTDSPEITSAELAEAQEATELEIDTSVGNTEMNVTLDQPGTLSKLPPADQPNDGQWQEAKDQISWLLTALPERFGEVYQEYKKPITTAAIALAAVPFVVLTVALLRMINAIPLFAPTFELVGFGYASWFVYRYLLFADRRQELAQEYQSLKQRVLGGRS